MLLAIVGHAHAPDDCRDHRDWTEEIETISGELALSKICLSPGAMSQTLTSLGIPV